jgi:hypothetical protein
VRGGAAARDAAAVRRWASVRPARRGGCGMNARTKDERRTTKDGAHLLSSFVLRPSS